MSSSIDPELYADLVAVAAEQGFAEWRAMVISTGGCAEPIHLWGESRTIDAATGEVLARRPPGRLLVACGNRRHSRCPSCSETYRADTFQLVRAGLVGGKGVGGDVASRPKAFATFTAPSFGAVHHRVLGAGGRTLPCHPEETPIACLRRHQAGDTDLGQPLDPDSYDYVGAVIWNALATRLWARTVLLVNRLMARRLGITQRDWPAAGRVSVAKVAEFQARGLVHFHAIFRLDGPTSGGAPPADGDGKMLCELICEAAGSALIKPPASRELVCPAAIAWGEQVEVRVVRADEVEGKAVTVGQVAGYLAKYATKGTDARGTLDHALVCRDCAGSGRAGDGLATRSCWRCGGSGLREDNVTLPVSAHTRTMILTCWRLGGIPELEHLRLRPWAHMLGFRGHFSTKSRRYSTTLGSLREARRQWRTERAGTGLDSDAAAAIHRSEGDEDSHVHHGDTVESVATWRFAGRGHSPGQAVYAATIASDLADDRRIARETNARDEHWGVP
jgi:hypothetical protein